MIRFQDITLYSLGNINPKLLSLVTGKQQKDAAIHKNGTTQNHPLQHFHVKHPMNKECFL